MEQIKFRVTLIIWMLAVSITLNGYQMHNNRKLSSQEDKKNVPVIIVENTYTTPDTLSEWSLLQLAIAMTESEFKPDAVGKTEDFGIYQITPIYVKEINRLLGEEAYTHDQAFDMTKSVEMFNVFQSFKNPEKDIDTAIYFHNKASWYKTKVLRNYETVKRYEELRSILQYYNNPESI